MAISTVVTPGRAPHSGSRPDTPDPVPRLDDPSGLIGDLDMAESPERMRRSSRIVGALLVAVAILASLNSARKSLWTDESYTLDTVRRSWAGTWSQALHFELQPPAYFLILHAWMTAGGGVIVARLLSTLCVLTLLWICLAIGRLLKLPWPPLVAVLAACTPGVIWAASEARNYPLTLLLAAGSLYCFLHLTLDPPARPTRLTVAYVALASLSVCTFYYSAFLLLGQWLAALVTGRQRARITTALATAGLVTAPLLPLAYQQWHSHPIELPAAAPSNAGLGYAIYTTLATIEKAFLGDTMLFGLPHAVPILFVALTIVVLARVVSTRARVGADERMLLLAAIVPVVCLGTLMTAHLVPIRPRHFLLLVPVSLTCIAVAASRIRRRGARRVAATCLATTLVAALAIFEFTVVNTEDWRGIARYLATRTAPGDRVLVFDPDRLLPLRYYYHGPAALAGLPTDPDLDRYQPAGYALHDTAMVRAQVLGNGPGHRIFIIEASRLLPELAPSIAVISRALAQCCVVRTTRAFPGATVIEAEGVDHAR